MYRNRKDLTTEEMSYSEIKGKMPRPEASATKSKSAGQTPPYKED
jgi:hypothetical protein